MRQPFRLEPALPKEKMKTYSVRSPHETHWRVVSCEEDGCQVSAMGWTTVVDESTALGQKQAGYIRQHSGRNFTEERSAGVTSFRFTPGEECFTEHSARVDRPEIYIVRGGDHRGPVGEMRVHERPEDWVEDFQTHQDGIRSTLERG